MHSFLKNTAKEILESGVDLQKLTVVLPNRKSRIVFYPEFGKPDHGADLDA